VKIISERFDQKEKCYLHLVVMPLCMYFSMVYSGALLHNVQCVSDESVKCHQSFSDEMAKKVSELSYSV